MNKISLMIEPTNRCNLRCTTCYSHQDGRDKVDMSFDSFRKIIDDNRDLIDRISLYNYGEPLINKELFKMVAYAKQKGVRFVKVATNGTLLDDVNSLKSIKSGLDMVSISLDGACQETYSKFRVGGDFFSVIRNVKNLVKLRDELGSKLCIELQFIIMEHNKHEIDKIKDLAIKLGVDILRYKKVLIKQDKWQDLLPAEKEYNRYSFQNSNVCSKPVKELVICSDGEIIPCCYVVGDDIKLNSLGNIFNVSLGEIFKGGRYQDFCQNCSKDKNLNKVCANCRENIENLDFDVLKLK